MAAVVLEKSLVTQQPNAASNENVVIQEKKDYNSIAREENDTVIDLIMQTQLKTEPITTPEPRKIPHLSVSRLPRILRYCV